jgi:tetratricopeptide (TPR) repeat protein
MRRALSLLFIILSLLVFKNLAFAQPEVDACFNFYDARDYKRAIEAGKRAVQKYPNNSDAHYCLGISYRMVGEFKLALEHLKKGRKLNFKQKSLDVYLQSDWIDLRENGLLRRRTSLP